MMYWQPFSVSTLPYYKIYGFIKIEGIWKKGYNQVVKNFIQS